MFLDIKSHMVPHNNEYDTSVWQRFGTARPRGTLPHGTLTLMGHCFEKGPKILRYTVLHCYLQHITKM